MTNERVRELTIIAAKIRKGVISSIFTANSGHPGGSLSIADILSVLMFEKMNISAEKPSDPNRDRLVLSKGHAAPAIYAALSLKGYFPEEELLKLRRISGILQGHPDMNKIPGIDISTGSLGLGLSAANGMALAAHYSGMNYRVYCIMGDGEIQEGIVWEAAMTASHYNLDNLTAFIDFNGLQIDGPTSKIMWGENPVSAFKSFGWNTLEIDGHDIEAINNAVDEAKMVKGKPTLIIAHTVKGKGVSYMENQISWHGKAPNKEQYEQAIAELNSIIKELEVGK